MASAVEMGTSTRNPFQIIDIGCKPSTLPTKRLMTGMPAPTGHAHRI